MTVKELYEYCVKHNCENKPLAIDYTCDDCWYDCYKLVTSNDIFIGKNEIEITINNN